MNIICVYIGHKEKKEVSINKQEQYRNRTTEDLRMASQINAFSYSLSSFMAGKEDTMSMKFFAIIFT